MAAKAERLDLSTTGEIERVKFGVDDKLYEFRNKDELSLGELKRITFAGKVLNNYFDGDDEPNEDDDAKAQQMLDDTVGRMTVGLSKKVLAGLGDLQKFELVLKFSEVNGLTADADAKQ